MLNKEWDKSLARLALTCVASEVPSTDVDKWWLLQRRILRHAVRCEQLIVDSKIDMAGLEWALHILGDLYADQGKLAEAEKMYIWALQGKEEALGNIDLRVIISFDLKTRLKIKIRVMLRSIYDVLYKEYRGSIAGAGKVTGCSLQIFAFIISMEIGSYLLKF